ncbi:MAG: DUF6456 domain-containing protein [Pseudomonadota bacterium]
MAAQSNKARKHAVAALRHLASGGRTGCTVVKAQAHIKLVGPSGERAVPYEMVARWVASGLASHPSDARIAITPTGRAHLKRAIHDLEASQADLSSAHASQHRDLSNIQIKLPDNSLGHATANLSESPLGWLYRRKDTNGQPMLTDAQFQAGERLRSDYERGALRQRVSANWEAALSGGKRGASRGGADLTDAAIDARTRVEKALRAVSSCHSGLLEDVCCHLKTLSVVNNERNWPKGTARIVLAIALQELAGHYGLLGRETERRSGIRSWGDGAHVPIQAMPDP